jgi:hypothetical protein
MNRAVQGRMRRALLVFAMAGAHNLIGQSTGLDDPPTILNLGSNVRDGSVTMTCSGEKPYSKLACKVYRLGVRRSTLEEYQKARSELQKYLAERSEADLRKMRQDLCSRFKPVKTDVATYSPGRAASAQHFFEQMKALCGCITTQCIKTVTLDLQTEEKDECTVHSSVFPLDFVKVSDRKWVSNNGPEGICGVVSVFTIEHEASSTVLWNYTEQHTYSNNSEGFCKGLPNIESAFYSWQSGSSIRLPCTELKLEATPELS